MKRFPFCSLIDNPSLASVASDKAAQATPPALITTTTDNCWKFVEKPGTPEFAAEYSYNHIFCGETGSLLLTWINIDQYDAGIASPHVFFTSNCQLL